MCFDNKKLVLTHAYVHRLADVHLAGFAPAFTWSLCDSETARKSPVPIAFAVTSKPKKKRKKKTVTYYLTTKLKTENLTTLDNFENC